MTHKICYSALTVMVMLIGDLSVIAIKNDYSLKTIVESCEPSSFTQTYLSSLVLLCPEALVFLHRNSGVKREKRSE